MVYTHIMRTEQEQYILRRVKNLPYTPGSKLKTTLLFRQIIWEILESKKLPSHSNWMQEQELVGEALDVLVRAGISGARLAILPFELTKDGATINWKPLETAIDMLISRGMSVDLCVGPIDYPYAPGIRLPQPLEELLRNEFAQTDQDTITIGSEPDPSVPQSSAAITQFCYTFLEKQMKRYGTDERISTICFGNEWPNKHGVEGHGLYTSKVCVTEELMKKLGQIILNHTQKPVFLNTNIHPSRFAKFNRELGGLVQFFGPQALVAFDVYPTEERKVLREFIATWWYGCSINRIRRRYPQAQLAFGEFQAELFAAGNLAGKPWLKILELAPKEVHDFFMSKFPGFFKSHVIPSRITDISLWGAPKWIALALAGYDFPIELLRTVADSMKAVTHQTKQT